MHSDYRELFGADGPLARALPGYAYRPEQAAMAQAVGAALARLEPLIVEAGTGTGKTFAYLVPALLSGRSVIISTGTRTLQDQLFRRDVPLLAQALGMPVKFALLKGRCELPLPPSPRARDPARRVAAARARADAPPRARHALGRERPRAATSRNSPICPSSRRSGPASPRRARTVSARNARNSPAAMCLMRAARPRPPTSSSSITICCSRILRSRTKASAICCRAPKP